MRDSDLPVEQFIKDALREGVRGFLTPDLTPMQVRRLIAVFVRAYADRLEDPKVPIARFNLSWSDVNPHQLLATETLSPEKPLEWITLNIVTDP